VKKKKPVVGLALGAGASRGLAHFGVLKVLEEADIPIDVIAGSSIGSVAGALYASGSDLNLLIKMSEHLRQQQYIDISVPRWGLIKGKKIEELLKLLTKNLTFDQLKIPLYVVAVDIIKGKEYVFSDGYVYEALRASISIPGIFEPKKIGEKLFVDGAVLNSVPINVIKNHGVDIVIGVDIKSPEMIMEKKSINNIFDVLINSIDLMQAEKKKNYSKEADILIEPDLLHINPARFDKSLECINIGIEAAKKVLPDIISLLNKNKI
jgi:NTE family protein